MLNFKSGGFRSILISCLIAGIVVLSVAIASPQASLATPLQTLMAAVADRAPEPNLKQGAQKAEKASEKVYEGLERTQKIIGKTEKRNDAIKYARQHASERWNSLADKTRAVERSEDSLSPVDKVNLDLINGSQQK
jgi:hypothetical protein